jgi:hypothetical protein
VDVALLTIERQERFDLGPQVGISGTCLSEEGLLLFRIQLGRLPEQVGDSLMP